MALRQISDKISLRSFPGNVIKEFSTIVHVPTSGDGIIFTSIGLNATQEQFNILDGRGFPLRAPIIFNRTGLSSITPWAWAAQGNGDLIGAYVDLTNINRENFTGIITASSNYNSVSIVPFEFTGFGATPRLLCAATRPNPSPPGNIPAAVAASFSVAIPFNTDVSYSMRISNVDSAGTRRFFFDFGVNLLSRFINGALIAYNPIQDNFVAISKFTGGFGGINHSAGDITGVVIPLNGGFPSGILILNQAVVTAAASASYQDGPAAIGWDNTDNKFIILNQHQTSAVTFTHDVQLIRTDDSMNLVGSPQIIFSSTPGTGPSRTSEQAGQDIIFTPGTHKCVFALQTVDFPGPNSKLILYDLSLNSIADTIDLGAPGPVRLGMNGSRIVVMHQELIGSTSNVYLKTYQETSSSLAPMAIRLRDSIGGSTTVSETNVVSIDVGTPSIPPSGFLLSESQQTRPLDATAPPFSASNTGEISLSGTGVRTVYAWYTNPTVSLIPNISTIFVNSLSSEPGFTHILKSGTNLITPALESTPPLRASRFLTQSTDQLFYLDANANIQFVLGIDIQLDPGSDILLEGSIGYLVFATGLSGGQIRTISYTGDPLSN